MTVYSTGFHHRSYIWQLTLVSFVLGLILAATIQTASQVSRAGNGPDREGFVFGSGSSAAMFTDLNKQIHSLQSENSHLRRNTQKLNDQIANRTGATSTLNQELLDAQEFAGLTEVAGPGIQVTLNDNSGAQVSTANPVSLNNLVHDADIMEVVNEMKISGAEAIAVNGQRIVNSSTIRCVGPVIQVNGVPCAPPYIVQAIGDPDSLYGGMNLPGGILSQMSQTSPSMVHMIKEKKVILPAYSGDTQFHYSHIVPVGQDPLASTGS